MLFFSRAVLQMREKCHELYHVSETVQVFDVLQGSALQLPGNHESELFYFYF